MTRWTQDEEETLLELYQTDHTYEEMAEALVGRSTAAVKAKLKRLTERSETTLPIYRGEGRTCTEPSPEAQQIYDEMILALLDEFRKIRETLPHLGKKRT